MMALPLPPDHYTHHFSVRLLSNARTTIHRQFGTGSCSFSISPLPIITGWGQISSAECLFFGPVIDGDWGEKNPPYLVPSQYPYLQLS
ncbi:hypothetical protein GDO78_013961 [Eleutherodactylus coqui]|uniref:Uncharacterized protein n=1 Tax=Eleutherodactylus coqui TaxID=57060 RepID=A0A8J6EF56_ELECQ|nr:hypothetical protein GDO78_013961 [Eleutherodactylus coqui]